MCPVPITGRYNSNNWVTNRKPIGYILYKLFAMSQAHAIFRQRFVVSNTYGLIVNTDCMTINTLGIIYSEMIIKCFQNFKKFCSRRIILEDQVSNKNNLCADLYTSTVKIECAFWH